MLQLKLLQAELAQKQAAQVVPLVGIVPMTQPVEQNANSVQANGITYTKDVNGNWIAQTPPLPNDGAPGIDHTPTCSRALGNCTVQNLQGN